MQCLEAISHLMECLGIIVGVHDTGEQPSSKVLNLWKKNNFGGGGMIE